MENRSSKRRLPLNELIGAILLLALDIIAAYFILTSGFITGAFKIVLLISCVILAIADIVIVVMKY